MHTQKSQSENYCALQEQPCKTSSHIAVCSDTVPSLEKRVAGRQTCTF